MAELFPDFEQLPEDEQAELISAPCQRCERLCPVELTPDLPHYGKSKCADCGHFWWVAKPDGHPTKYQPISPNVRLVKKIGIYYCQLCQRLPEQLRGEDLLEAHHVVAREHGGTDDPSNLWILCTPCHRYVHHMRTYFGNTEVPADDPVLQRMQKNAARNGSRR